MIDLKQWVDRNANRPLAYTVSTVLCLQVGYLAYLAQDEYTARLHRIDRVVETASLGIQQDNRPLIESTLITGLRNSDAATVALCRAGEVNLLYPPSTMNPCRETRGGLLQWTIRRKAVGLNAYEFVFVIDRLAAFGPLAVLLMITAALSLAVILVLLRARRRFTAEILDPLSQGLNADEPLGISELDELRRKNKEHIAMSRRQAVSDALFDFSAQVAHDIRSPLAVLEAVSSDDADWEKKRIMLRNAIGRLRGIANSVLNRYRTTATGKEALLSEAEAVESGEPVSVQLLSNLIGPVLAEKPVEFGPAIDIGVEYGSDSYGLFASIQPVEFARALSNLINNAAEALGKGPGRILIGLFSSDGDIAVRVKDNGKGIPPEVLAKLGQRGVSHGKEGGHGRGLFHARSRAEAWGGRLEIESLAGEGTTVTLFIPRADAPNWFASEITPHTKAAVIVLDDDPGMHDVWRKRFDDAGVVAQGVRLCDFQAPGDLRDWVKRNPAEAKRGTYLLDYEMGPGVETGLDIASELDLKGQAVLVTGRHEEKEVMAACRNLGVRLLPKELAALVPIRIRDCDSPCKPTPLRLDAVLIDDDSLTRMIWQNAASDLGKRFRAFSSTESFLRESAGVDFKTPLYIDAKLADGVDGAKESLRIHEMGFREIYLATGHPPSAFQGFKHLQGVVGKEPPWGVTPTSPKTPEAA